MKPEDKSWLVKGTLEYDFDRERKFKYKGLSDVIADLHRHDDGVNDIVNRHGDVINGGIKHSDVGRCCDKKGDFAQLQANSTKTGGCLGDYFKAGGAYYCLAQEKSRFEEPWCQKERRMVLRGGGERVV
ncbi:MAG: hypothetical protein IKF72_02440 [Kiritimatiellae bacterium]|nr:hypothetical protein [Kiritimatiellia bacterium]